MYGKRSFEHDYCYNLKVDGKYVFDFNQETCYYKTSVFSGDWYTLKQLLYVRGSIIESGYHGLIEVIMRAEV